MWTLKIPPRLLLWQLCEVTERRTQHLTIHFFADAMPAKTEKEIRAIFDSMDKNGNGEVTVAELETAYNSGFAQSLVGRLDEDKDGKVSWEEYIKFLRDKGLVKEEQAEDQKNDSWWSDRLWRTFNDEEMYRIVGTCE